MKRFQKPVSRERGFAIIVTVSILVLLADFEWEDGQRGKAVSRSMVSLAAGVEEPVLGEFVHDYTVHSAGVLADVRSGRLKRDLSNLLAHTEAG